jgi:hypothetical protein
MGPGAPLELSLSDDRAALQVALSAYFAGQQLAILGGAYVERSLIPSTLLCLNAWRPLPHLIAWAAVLAWGGCAALAVSFEVLAWRARQRLLAVLPRAREAVFLHFAPTPRPSVSLLVLLVLVLLSGMLWAHALRSDLVPPAVVSLGSRTWVVLAVLWLAVKTNDPVDSTAPRR